jgi:adenylate cyclase
LFDESIAMPVEIERKFLVTGDGWQPLSRSSERLLQGYLSRGDRVTVRVRQAGMKAFLTVKGEGGLARAEFEYEIPLAHAQAMLSELCDPPLIEKIRHEVHFAGLLWQIDVFEGEHAGLVLAEIELTSPDQPLELPPWLGEEVTGDPRYFNANLAARRSAAPMA